MMNQKMYRCLQSLLLLFSLAVLGLAFYLQHVDHLEPCPLCLMQRFCGFLFIFFCLIGLCLSKIRAQKRILLIQLVMALAGLFFALRQLWLQNTPNHVAACLPGFDVILQYFPWRDVLHALFWGSADCAIVGWTFLSLSIPAWSALYFFGLFVGCLWIYSKRQSQKPVNTHSVQ
jgi:disulfide bond formation protein DsbB